MWVSPRGHVLNRSSKRISRIMIQSQEELETHHASPDKERLYAKHHHMHCLESRAINLEIERQNLTLFPNQQALLAYGAYRLFMAADKKFVGQGERDPLRKKASDL